MLGTGTQVDPFIIQNVTDLQAMENDLSAYYELEDNIDASATSGWNGGLGFDPIGNSGDGFAGSFDGKGFTVDQLFIDRPLEAYVGLFGWVESFIAIKNVGITNCDITGMRYTAALVGRKEEDAGGQTISNCYATGAVKGERSSNGSIIYVAGLIGIAFRVTISDCYSTCSVTITNSSSGSFAHIEECGGFLGSAFIGTTIVNCYATGNITATGNKDIEDTGGFCGKINLSDVGSVTQCYATGSITINAGDQSQVIGGFVGSYDGTTLSDCYSRGNLDITVVTNNVGKLGGFAGAVGSSFTMTNCYSTGSITRTTGMPDIGGFCGDNGGTITNCFWDTETSSEATSDGGTGKTTAQMKTQSTFTGAGWDFDTIWHMDGYPVFNIQTRFYPTDPLLRTSGIVRTFWSGIGGQSVYQTQLILGGVSTNYVSPIGKRQPVGVVESQEPPSRAGYTQADFQKWLLTFTSPERRTGSIHSDQSISDRSMVSQSTPTHKDLNIDLTMRLVIKFNSSCASSKS